MVAGKEIMFRFAEETLVLPLILFKMVDQSIATISH